MELEGRWGEETNCYSRLPKLAHDIALFHCMFNDPWESYCPWNFIIFNRKFKTRKLFVVERWNQLECDKWPSTLKICQGQSSSSPKFYENMTFYNFYSR
jgi:hypothetical protein